MKTSRILLMVIILVGTNAATAFVLQRYDQARDFTEVTVVNDSSGIVQTLWLQCGSLGMREHGMKPGDRKRLRFYAEGPASHTCEIMVTGDTGGDSSYEMKISNGQKSTVHITKDEFYSD